MVARIFAWIVWVLLAGLFVEVTVNAVGNAVQLPQMAASLGLGINALGWFWLAAQIALPLVVLLVAVILGWRRGMAARLLLLVAGISLVAAVQLEITQLVPAISFLG